MDVFMIYMSFFMAPVELTVCSLNLAKYFSKLVLKLLELKANLETISSNYVPCVDDE